MILRNNIRDIRKSLHMTQSGLAIRCEVARNTITSLERYENFPSAALAFRICNVLGKSFEEVFYFED